MPFVEIDVDPGTLASIDGLRTVLEEHAGDTPVVVAVRARRLLLGSRFNVQTSPELTAALRRLELDARVVDAAVPR